MCERQFWIIGNGFDLNHGLETKYSDFKQYLLEYDSTFIDMLESGSIFWSSFEESLAYLDFDDLLTPYRDDYEVYDNVGISSHNMIETLSSVREVLSRLNNNLFDWINTISYDEVKRNEDFVRVLSNNSHFLNFNYTSTLERVYAINPDRICHIHGSVFEDTLLVMGHNQELKETNVDKRFLSEFYTREPVASDFSIDDLNELEDEKNKIHNDLRKNTSDILLHHQTFFDILQEVDSVYSYGFSYGVSDEVYIQYIINLLNTRSDINNIIWHIQNHDLESTNRITSKLQHMGFQGQIVEF